MATLDVYAVSPASLTASVSVNANGPTISNFTPATAAKDQADLVVAYSQAKRADGTNISLKFNHALSQIEVNATGVVTGVNETKHVWIKGAWLMNVCSSGTLAFDKDKATENYMNWSKGSEKTKYGIEFTSVQALDHTNVPLLASRFGSSNMLLVPQQLDTWDLNDEADKADNASKGAYILVLCRVEATHPGKEHPNSDGSVFVDGENHVHQLFPYYPHIRQGAVWLFLRAYQHQVGTGQEICLQPVVLRSHKRSRCLSSDLRPCRSTRRWWQIHQGYT